MVVEESLASTVMGTIKRMVQRPTSAGHVGPRLIVVGLILSVGLAVPLGAAAASQPVVDGHGAGIAAFEKRLAEYAAMRDEIEASLPPFNETNDPVMLTARQRQLAQALIQARAGVTQGDVFVGPSRPVLEGIIHADFAKRSRADKRALDEDMPRGTKVTANAEYPDGVMVATVPPGLLRQLPSLPDELEYRIVGRDLILLDNKARLVVDVLPGVVPR